MKFATLYILILLSCSYTIGQELNFKQFSVNQGLPSSQVYGMYQAKNGYMWFATDRGLARYNGYEFEVFGVDTGLPGNVILNLFPQKNGDIWFSTINNQVFYYKQDINEFEIYPYNHLIKEQSKPPSVTKIECIYVNKNSSVHLAFTGKKNINEMIISSNGKLLKVAKNQISDQKDNIYINYKKNTGETPYFFFNNIKDNSKEFQVKINNYETLKATYLKKNNVCAFIINGSVVIVNSNGTIVSKIKTNSMPLNVVAIDESHIMIGYRFGGAVIVDSFGKTTSRYLKDKSITNMLIDHQGGYWFSSLNSGVYYLKNPNLKLLKHPHNLSVSVNSLAKNDNNELYIGYDNGDVVKLNKEHKTSFVFHQIDNKSAKVSYSINKKLLYFFSNDLYLSKGNMISKIIYEKRVFVRKISEEQKEGIIISTDKGVLINKKNAFDKLINTEKVMRDASFWNGKIYFATTSGLYSNYNDSIQKITYKNQSLNFRIEDIDVNPWNNKLYVATLGKGLFVLNDNNATNFTKKDGLLSNIINEVYIENEQTTWLATNGGLNNVVFNNSNSSIETLYSLDSNNGLVNNEVRDVEIIGDTIWIATKGGLMYTNKTFFNEEQNKDEHFLNIKEIKVNDNLVDFKDLKSLSYNNNYINFFVEDVSFKEDNNLTYYYSLKGLSNKWYETKNRNIRFSSLSYGDYTFKITTCSKKDKCTKHIVEQFISISPPFWKTWWFRSLTILFITTIIYVFFKVRILSYNRNITRELIRLIIKRITKKEHYLFFREAGQEVKIKSKEIIYIKSSGNYVDIITINEQFTIRKKLSEFISITPDPLEYLRVHRMYIVRLDNIRSKSKSKIIMLDSMEIPVGRTYINQLEKIQ